MRTIPVPQGIQMLKISSKQYTVYKYLFSQVNQTFSSAITELAYFMISFPFFF